LLSTPTSYDDTVELYADRTRALPVIDPDDRELTISCGAALLHLRIALRHFGYAGAVATLPDSDVVVNTDVADVLIGVTENGEYMQDTAGFDGCDVIALATHGRGGLERWVKGSVTERVPNATKLPLLVVYPRQKET
jgi:nucleotide-binding universal stress UspA family protein